MDFIEGEYAKRRFPRLTNSAPVEAARKGLTARVDKLARGRGGDVDGLCLLSLSKARASVEPASGAAPRHGQVPRTPAAGGARPAGQRSIGRFSVVTNKVTNQVVG